MNGLAWLAAGLLARGVGALQTESRLRGLDALEVYLVTVPKDFANQPDAPVATDLRAIVEHRVAADKVPLVSFLAVSSDPVKLHAYEALKKGHLIVDVQLLRSGGAFAYNVTAQVVEDAKVTRTGASILVPIWSRATIGVAGGSRLKAAVRDQIVDDLDELAVDFAKANS